MCANGATDIEVADELDVTVRTIYAWRSKYPEFLQAIKTCKEIADERVERSLYHRAVGYEQVAVKIFMPAGAEEPVYAPYREAIPPESSAAMMWLKNRKPNEWRDKRDVEVSGSIKSILVPERIGTERSATDVKPEFE